MRQTDGQRRYTTNPGDTLWDLAQHFYGDGNRWYLIYEANQAVIGPDPHLLSSGCNLAIPPAQLWNPPNNHVPAQSATPPSFPAIRCYNSRAAVYIRRLNGFVVFANYGSQLLQYSRSAWHSLDLPPAGITLSPGAARRAPDALHLTIRGGDTHLYHRYWDGTIWSNWENIGGDLASGPAMVSQNPSRLDCFALGMFRNLIHCSWNPRSGWSRWEDLSPTMPDARFDIQFAPSVASWSENRLDVFAVRIGSGELLHAWWDGAWHGWERLGGVLTEAPCVVARGPNLLDVYGRGRDDQLYHLAWDGQRWSGWLGLGSSVASAPAAAVGPTEIALFARSQSNLLQRLA
jgi:hypothetical protein